MIFNSLHVMILAGGKGTRLRSVVSDRPKVMAEVSGKPFLNWILDHLHQQGVREVTLLTGYMADQIQDFYGPQYKDIQLYYSHEVVPLGTGGAVKLALERQSQPKTICLLLNGDTYFPANLVNAITLQDSLTNTVLTSHVSDISRYGSLQIDTLSRKVLRFNEKGLTGPGFINAGTYLLESRAFLDFPQKTFSLENDLLKPLVSKGRLTALVDKAPFIDIGIPADYANFQHIVSGR